MREMFCPSCADERPFQQPSCGEHDACPEWFCAVCGTAVLVGVTVAARRADTTVAA